MKVVYTRAWVNKKPSKGYWYPVVRAEEVTTADNKLVEKLRAVINAQEQIINGLRAELEKVREDEANTRIH